MTPTIKPRRFVILPRVYRSSWLYGAWYVRWGRKLWFAESLWRAVRIARPW
jgi:hypothetical protein